MLCVDPRWERTIRIHGRVWKRTREKTLRRGNDVVCVEDRVFALEWRDVVVR